MRLSQLNEGPCVEATEVGEDGADITKAIKKYKNRKRNYNDDGIAPPKGHHNTTSNRWAESKDMVPYFVKESSIDLLRNVARQMEKDAHSGDFTAIEELLQNVSEEELKAFLSDHRSPDWTEESKEEQNESIWAKNKEDPMNPEVLIQGYGRLMLNQIEDDLVRKFNALKDMATKKDWDNIDYQLNKTGVIQAFIKAITDTYNELEEIRRRGGMNSRGIKQR
jgi:hypothetical protein